MALPGTGFVGGGGVALDMKLVGSISGASLTMAGQTAPAGTLLIGVAGVSGLNVRTINSLTVNGVAATAITTSPNNYATVRWYRIAHAGGPTGNLVITASGALVRAGYTMWVVEEGTVSIPGSGSSTTGTSSITSSQSAAIQADDYLLSMVAYTDGAANSETWSVGDETLDYNVATDGGFSTSWWRVDGSYAAGFTVTATSASATDATTLQTIAVRIT